MDNFPPYSLLVPEEERFDPRFYRLLLEVEKENREYSMTIQRVDRPVFSSDFHPHREMYSTLDPFTHMNKNAQKSQENQVVKDLQIPDIFNLHRPKEEYYHQRYALEPVYPNNPKVIPHPLANAVPLTSFPTRPCHTEPPTPHIFRNPKHLNQTGTPDLRARMEYHHDEEFNSTEIHENDYLHKVIKTDNHQCAEYVPPTASAGKNQAMYKDESEDELAESATEDNADLCGEDEDEIDFDALPHICDGYTVFLRPMRRRDTGYATLGTFPAFLCASTFKYYVKIVSTFCEVHDEEFTFSLIGVNPDDEETCFDVHEGVEYELASVRENVSGYNRKVYVFVVNFTVTSFRMNPKGAEFRLLVQCDNHKLRLKKMSGPKEKRKPKREYRLQNLFSPRLGDMFLSSSFSLVARKKKALDDRFWDRFLNMEFHEGGLERRKPKKKKKKEKRKREKVVLDDVPLKKRLRRKRP